MIDFQSIIWYFSCLSIFIIAMDGLGFDLVRHQSILENLLNFGHDFQNFYYRNGCNSNKIVFCNTVNNTLEFISKWILTILIKCFLIINSKKISWPLIHDIKATKTRLLFWFVVNWTINIKKSGIAIQIC
ncbi:unnamed protein product [Blepharisma stoltei]|uniref:Uncharacterized protein n=1 Tax=Blepharisma stoltei TaxID=1481888 RepID=A0AAU9J286_9CILI|nr:unnamed protein product [Blepharisma stoltei]